MKWQSTLSKRRARMSMRMYLLGRLRGLGVDFSIYIFNSDSSLRVCNKEITYFLPMDHRDYLIPYQKVEKLMKLALLDPQRRDLKLDKPCVEAM